MRLYLIRHGETDSNVQYLLDTAHPGAPLNATGLAQADALAERLGDLPIEAVYASDLTRAVQTATPLAERLGVPVVQLPGLREIPAGALEMHTDWQPYIDALFRWVDEPEFRLEGGENAAEFTARYDAAIAQIAAAGHGVAALISHGAAMRVWIPHSVQNLTTPNERRLANTDIVVLEGSPDDGWVAVSWADEVLPDPAVEIRRATNDDLDALVDLRESMLVAFDPAEGLEDGWREAFKLWAAARLDDDRFAMIVASDASGQVVAGAQGELIEGQPGPEVNRWRVLITNVSTLPSARGRGLASRCMDAVLDWAQDMGATSAVLNAAPMGAQIYQRAGFETSSFPEMRLHF